MNRLKKKNTIIALAVLAVFVVCVSIARLSVKNPFEAELGASAQQASAEQEPSYYQEPMTTKNPDKPTITRSASITTSADAATFTAVRDLDMSTLNRLMSGRYILNYVNFDASRIVEVYGESAEYYYQTYMVPYPVFDSKSLVEFDTYATDIRTYPGTYYDEVTHAVAPDLLWLVKHSTPYLSLEDARAYYVSIGYPSDDALQLTEDDIFYATQLVIWRQMHGITTWTWAGYVGDSNPLVPSLYALLTANLGADVSIFTDVTVTPGASLTLKRDTWGPFNLSTRDLPDSTDATVPYNITLMADKPGLEVLIVDKDGAVMSNVPANGDFYIRFTNYNKLPESTTYTIRIDAASTQPVRIQRTGMLESKELLLENNGLAATPLLYGYTIQSTLRNSLTVSFTTSDHYSK